MLTRHALTAAVIFVSAALGVARAAEGRPFRITGLCHIGMWVRDIEQSRAFYKGYLGFEEAYTLPRATGELFVVFFKVNDRQTINLYPNPAKILPNGDNLYHVGLETDKAAAFHDYLVAHGVVAGAVHKTPLGDLIFLTKDPDGIGYEITEYQPDGRLARSAGQFLPETRAGQRIIATTLVVKDLAASRRFYCDLLGCTEVKSGNAGIVRLQLPDSLDAILLSQRQTPAGAPAPRSQERFTLQSRDVAKVVADLNEPNRRGVRPLATVAKGCIECTDPDGCLVTFTAEEGPRPARSPHSP